MSATAARTAEAAVPPAGGREREVGGRLRRRLGWDGPLPQITDAELLALIACNLLTTIGLTGDIARHLESSADLSDDFLSGWHLVLYGGVTAVGVWLGVGAIRRGPAFPRAAATTVVGFGLLALGGVADAAWHGAFGTEAAVEALVSPPHLVVFAGLAFLLTSPVVVLWRRPTVRLNWAATVVVTVSVVSTVLVTSLFTGFLSPLAGGMSLQTSYVEPLVGESLNDYDQVRGLGIAVWTSALLAAAFTLVLVRFRLRPGALVVAFSLIGVPGLVVEGEGIGPLVAGFVATGLVVEVAVAVLARPVLGRLGAAITGALTGSVLWATTFVLLEADDRLGWTEALWGGTITLSALVGAAVASLVAFPASAPPVSTLAVGSHPSDLAEP